MKIAIIGCGNMGGAIAKRLASTNQLFLYDRHTEKTEKLAQEGFGKACQSMSEALQASEMIILAVKPQNINQTAGLIKEKLKGDQIIVSLLAGTKINTLLQHFPNMTVVRMMPNLPIIHGDGVIGFSSDEKTKSETKELLTNTFKALGKVYWLPEEKMNALTSLAGSGPAFVYAMIEAMVDAGIAMGFTSQEAQDIAQNMLRGSLNLLDKSGKHPGELKWQITSPQGTTIAGLKRLEELALRGAIINTFLAAYDRSKEISTPSK